MTSVWGVQANKVPFFQKKKNVLKRSLIDVKIFNWYNWYVIHAYNSFWHNIYNIYYIYIYVYVYKREFKSCLEELENEMLCLEENKLV